MELEVIDPQISYFLSLPDEVISYEIFPRLPLGTLNNLCRAHLKFNNICLNDTLWQIKTFNDLPTMANRKPANMAWRSFYMQLFIRRVPVEIEIPRCGISGHINLYSTSTIESLRDEVLNLLRQIYTFSFYRILFAQRFDPATWITSTEHTIAAVTATATDIKYPSGPFISHDITDINYISVIVIL